MQDVLNEKVALVSLSISGFTGYRRATREHIASLGGSLPSSAAITEGSIKVFPVEATNGLQTVRRGIFRQLQAKGVRAMGSQNVFAVLTEDLPEIEASIEVAKVNFMRERDELDQLYDQIFEVHCFANSEAEAIIRSLKVDRVTAMSRCRFSSNVFRIAPFVREGQSEEEGVEGLVRGLGRQLYEEVADEMQKLLAKECFAKNQRVGQKSLRPLKAAVEKMQKLAFLDGDVSGAIQLVQETLKVLPQQGYIEGQAFLTLERLVETMSDADTLLNAAAKVKNGLAACDVLFPPAPVVVPEAVQPAAEEVVADAAVETPVAMVEGKVLATLPPVTGNAVNTTSTLPNLPRVPPLGVTPAVPLPTGGLKPRTALKSNSLMF